MGRKHLLKIFPVILFTCFNSTLTAQLTDTSKLFPTEGRKQVSISKKVNVNADTLKRLLVIPNSNIWGIWAKQMNYFNEVMTIADFQKNIIAKGLTNKVPSISDRIGLYKAYIHYRPYVLLSQTIKHVGRKKFEVRLNLYDPVRADLIFQNVIHFNLLWEEYTDLKALFPLFNSLVGYLNEQR